MMEENMGSKNNDGRIVIALIISLLAFGLGSGIGISVGMSGDDLNSTDNKKPVNTTIDVTNNISQDNPNYNMDINSYEDYSEDSNSSNVSNSYDSGVYYSEEDLDNKSDKKRNITIE
jgi:hypothetical protein